VVGATPLVGPTLSQFPPDVVVAAALKEVVCPDSARVWEAGVLPNTVENCNDCGVAPILLTLNDTGTERLSVAPTKIEMDAPYVPGFSPAGSAVTVTAEGVVPDCGFMDSQFGLVVFEVAKKLTEELELVMFRVCDTFVPPDCAEKLMLVLSTDNVCASRPPAASQPTIRARIEKIRFNVNLQ
jgi:hypothetical protein